MKLILENLTPIEIDLLRRAVTTLGTEDLDAVRLQTKVANGILDAGGYEIPKSRKKKIDQNHGGAIAPIIFPELRKPNDS